MVHNWTESILPSINWRKLNRHLDPTWSNHINVLSKKIYSSFGSIKRISHWCVPPATLQNIYYGLVQSHFDYCSVVWGNCAKTLSDKLQKLQNRAVPVLSHSSSDADANQLLTELGWDNLETRRQKLKAEMVCKSLNGLTPNELSSKLIPRGNVNAIKSLLEIHQTNIQVGIPLNYLLKDVSQNKYLLNCPPSSPKPCLILSKSGVNSVPNSCDNHFA